MSLDPQAAAILEQAAKSQAPALGEGSVAEGREVWAKMTSLMGIQAPPVQTIQEMQIPGTDSDIRTLIITPNTPSKDPLPILIYYHGGGWVVGSPETYKEEACYYANKAECIVVLPDYRLAPEHVFPAAPEDCYSVLQWVSSYADRINGDASRIAIAGDSAGGNLTAVVAQMARDRKGPAIALQMLIYPATRMGATTQSYEDFKEGYFLTAQAMNWFFDHYLTQPGDWDDLLASPLLATNLMGLPPAYIMTAGFDPLRDEGKAYADKLKTAGVAVEYVCYEHQIHGFASLGGVLDEAQQFLDEASAVLRKAFDLPQ